MLIVEEKKIPKLIEEIKKTFEFFEHKKTGLPFKKYFFPPVQQTLNANSKGKIIEANAPKQFVLYGLGAKDLEALTQLDEIMKKPNEDFFYFQNRNRCVVIGVTHIELDSMPGGDIIFQKINDNQYRVWVEMQSGHNFIKKFKKFFTETSEQPETKITKSDEHKWSTTMRELLKDSELLSSVVEWSHSHPIWDELATTCLGCGVCTYVCPLCYCFSIEDKVDLDGKCSRCRKWDACTLPEFSEIAGGHTFRKSIKERYYNWFYHKFVRAYNEYGKSQCVGCGRCQRYCPAKIDIQEILGKILEDYKKSNSN